MVRELALCGLKFAWPKICFLDQIGSQSEMRCGHLEGTCICRLVECFIIVNAVKIVNRIAQVSYTLTFCPQVLPIIGNVELFKYITGLSIFLSNSIGLLHLFWSQLLGALTFISFWWVNPHQRGLKKRNYPLFPW